MTQTVTTEHAPGHPFKPGGWWWKMSFEAHSGLYTPPVSKIGHVITRLVEPMNGWICGFTPVWGPPHGNNKCHRSILSYKFTIIWPKFL